MQISEVSNTNSTKKTQEQTTLDAHIFQTPAKNNHQIPQSIIYRLSDNSFNETIFNKANKIMKQPYKNDFHHTDIQTKQYKECQQKKEISLNPPYNKNMKQTQEKYL